MSRFTSWTFAYLKIKKNNSSSQRELRPSVFQCDRFAQICLLLARPSSWSRNDNKFTKPWKMSLILSNMHSTWPKRATFLWQTFTVSCSKRNIFIGLVDTVVWETVSFKINMCEKTLTLHGWMQMVVCVGKSNSLYFYWIFLLYFSCIRIGHWKTHF